MVEAIIYIYICIYIYIYIYIIIIIIVTMLCYLHGYPWSSLTNFSLSFIVSGRSSGLHPVSSHSCCMYVQPGHPAFAWPYAGVHRSISLMSSSLLLQQCPASREEASGNYTWMLRAILNKSWQQHLTRHQLYGHLPPIMKTIYIYIYVCVCVCVCIYIYMYIKIMFFKCFLEK